MTEAVPELLELTAGPVAHGGHVVARVGDDPAGRVVFVRHAIPGERVRVRLTEADPAARYWRGDAVAVLEASPARVEPPCPYAGPGRCGGCDFQHVRLDEQRRLKAAVVTEQLARLGGTDVEAATGHPLVVAALPEPGREPGEETGLGWRTRVRYSVDPAGRVGFHPHREHTVLPVERCPLVADDVDATGVTRLPWPGVASVSVQAGEDGAVVRADPPRPSRGSGRDRRQHRGGGAGTAARPPRLPRVDALGLVLGGGHRVAGRTWVRHDVAGVGTFRVSGDGFWQVHHAAADTLVRLVRELAATRPGDTVLDLYAGAGLLSLALAADTGDSGRVVSVESDPRGAADLRRNAHDHPNVTVVERRVEAALEQDEQDEQDEHERAGVPSAADVVVLDPPRAGAGAAVLDRVRALGPRRLVVVSCDPAALGRDTGLLAARGYRLADLRALDAFPMTHHVECVALFLPEEPT
ncbi:class I SAM-dependent RNA methyltransferase [Aquipuribacter nitratireducens]|uniref:Class I SAM-dependent RNA methyltransferase n=1 Tax=Aquipuribacter nitratireducens TaxID=650104 RepID=A0ABW0GL77_9MICO